MLPSKPAKFAIGDKVRIRKKIGVFEKGYMPNWLKRFSLLQKYNAQTQQVTKYLIATTERFRARFMKKSFKNQTKRCSESKRL